MFHYSHLMKPSRLLFLLTSLLLPALSPIASAAGPVFGWGQSAAVDAKIAGSEAATKAKAALGATEPKVVLVFAARTQLTPQLIEGVAAVFDKSLIYGCEGYSPVTPEGNFAEAGHSIKAGVSILGMGGDVEFTPASAVVAKAAAKTDRPGVFRENGKAIGAALKQANSAAKGGKLILTFGNQHVGDNQFFVDGVMEELGKEIKMVGAAAGGDTACEIVRGEIVKGANVALLMTGHFKVNTAAGHGNEVQTADEAFKAVLGNGGNKAALIFVFDCGGRRGNMLKAGTLTQEWQAMKTNAGAIPFFGFYGGGEVGHQTLTGPCQGVGYHIATAAVIPE